MDFVVSIPIIVGLVYFATTLYKMLFKTEKAKQLIPVLAGICGMLLGIVMFYVYPVVMVGCPSVFHAALVGGASGLSAVGVNQVFKQSNKSAIDSVIEDDEDVD